MFFFVCVCVLLVIKLKFRHFKCSQFYDETMKLCHQCQLCSFKYFILLLRYPSGLVIVKSSQKKKKKKAQEANIV